MIKSKQLRKEKKQIGTTCVEAVKEAPSEVEEKVMPEGRKEASLRALPCHCRREDNNLALAFDMPLHKDAAPLASNL